jgi:hypothetical protein
MLLLHDAIKPGTFGPEIVILYGDLRPARDN